MSARHTWLRFAVTVLLCLLGAARPSAAGWEPRGAGFDCRTQRTSVRFARGDNDSDGSLRVAAGDGDGAAIAQRIDEPSCATASLDLSSALQRSALRSASRGCTRARGPPVMTNDV
jgi:hypothetical protein